MEGGHAVACPVPLVARICALFFRIAGKQEKCMPLEGHLKDKAQTEKSAPALRMWVR